MKQSFLPPFALIGFILGILIAFSAMLAGFGSRWGWWNFRIGFIILRWAAYGGILAAVISLIGAILTWPGVLHRNFLLSIFGLIIAILVFGVPLFYWRTAQRVPPIHDITTDWENPPGFVSILPLRKNAPNPAEYGGPKITEKQLEAYPDLAPAIFSFPVDEAF
jgi:hypothetical protein